MQITAKSDYALRAMCVLAVAGDGAPVKAAEIAAAQGIPPTFLDGILVQLRRGGMVSSRRGPGGGHQLARPAWSITLADVVRVIDGPLTLVHGQRPEQLAHEGLPPGCKTCGSPSVRRCAGSWRRPRWSRS